MSSPAWNHLVVNFGASDQSIYVNNVLSSSNASSTSPTSLPIVDICRLGVYKESFLGTYPTTYDILKSSATHQYNFTSGALEVDDSTNVQWLMKASFIK